jgi:hypothetical protein
MADVSARTPIFSRGSTVLAYWLVHAEGLIVQPLGSRVERVVVAGPVGHAEALIVRSRMTRRRKSIPAGSIAAVDPAAGHLLLDVPRVRADRRRIPRPSPDRIAAARLGAGRGLRIAHDGAAGAARVSQGGTRSALSWLRPRAVQAGVTTARHSRFAAAQTAAGAAWLVPRVASGAKTFTASVARLAVAVAVKIGQVAVRAAHELERGTADAAERGRTSLAARRAQREQRTPDD